MVTRKNKAQSIDQLHPATPVRDSLKWNDLSGLKFFKIAPRWGFETPALTEDRSRSQRKPAQSAYAELLPIAAQKPSLPQAARSDAGVLSGPPVSRG
jgi:hypothetical protein